MWFYKGSNEDGAVGNSSLILDDSLSMARGDQLGGNLRNLEKYQEVFSQVRPNAST